MDQIVDIASLATVIGATAAAGIITEFVKRLGPSTWGGPVYRRVAAASGVAVMVGAVVLSEAASVVSVALATLNGMIAGAAASQAYESITAAE